MKTKVGGMMEGLDKSSIYHVKLFDEKGFVRKQCASCGRNFWTLDRESVYCGDQPCQEYAFLGRPSTKASYSVAEVREKFLSFFERRGHRRVGRYPVVARWRDDVFFVGASIYDFQPWVTSGLVPPPANPLVISQPCVRLTDMDLVGRSGRHLTSFEMMAHHAFNTPSEMVYWTDETAAYCFEFLTSELGIKPERIRFIEEMWVGGGNAGEDFEVTVDGIELATLVYMHYKTEDDKLKPIENLTVDTGYGLERIAWLSQGKPTIYDTAFAPVVQELCRLTGYKIEDETIFLEASRQAGLVDIRSPGGLALLRAKVAERVRVTPAELEALMKPMELIYAVADFTRTLTFMLGDGVVPSNAEAGYLARLLIRRTLRNLEELRLAMPLSEVLSIQLKELVTAFPEYKRKVEIILRMVDLEEKRYAATLARGREIVSRLVGEAKAKAKPTIAEGELLKLYDSHGLTPDFVQQTAKSLGVEVEVPADFFSRIAKLHEGSAKSTAEETAGWVAKYRELAGKLPPTRLLYYEDSHIFEFKAKVLRIVDGKYLVLDQTAFYPEGGGQPPDLGIIRFKGGEAKVVDTQKIQDVIFHALEGEMPSEGGEVMGIVDRARRLPLMRQHTATHLIMGAAVRLLGDHVWQSGAQKDVVRSRLDIAHYEKLNLEQIHKLEWLANEAVMANTSVETMWMAREDAEAKFGFRLYQGGVVPGAKIRVVKIGDWDVEACGGTHCKSTGEVGLIKILKSERIQDGVERILFAAGQSAIHHIQQSENKIRHVAETLGVPVEHSEKAVEDLLSELKALRKEVERLRERTASYEASELLKKARRVNGVRVMKMAAENADLDSVIKTWSELVKAEADLVVVYIGITTNSARIVVMAGAKAVEVGVNAGKVTAELSVMLGGGGGGQLHLGQGGGPRLDKVNEALEAVEVVVGRQLRRG
ncbi:MAG: alanine--tRNA ligase [Candidatus Bathyarchaeia archaeon]